MIRWALILAALSVAPTQQKDLPLMPPADFAIRDEEWPKREPYVPPAPTPKEHPGCKYCW